MSFTGELSGLWSRSGIAPHRLSGVGFSAQGFNFSRPYHRTTASHDPRCAWIFNGVAEDEPIGDFGLVFGGAAGSEIDSADVHKGTPSHALVVATADDFGADFHWVVEDYHHAHSAVNGETCPHVRCDMVFYETQNGGAVFSTGSIAFAGSLSPTITPTTSANCSKMLSTGFWIQIPSGEVNHASHSPTSSLWCRDLGHHRRTAYPTGPGH